MVVIHDKFAFNSDANEILEHEVDNVLSTHTPGNPTHNLQAIANLETKSLSGKLMHVRSQTLCKNVSFLVRGGYKLRRDVLMLDYEARIDRCLVLVLLADNCWVSWTTAELSQ